MASLVQTKRAASPGTSVSATLDSTATLGNIIVAVVCIATRDPETDGSITGFNLCGSAAISGAGDEHIQVFAKVSEGSEAAIQYTHLSGGSRDMHIHLLEIAGAASTSLRVKATDESLAFYDHDDQSTLDNAAWNTGPLTGTGLMILGYVCNGTTNSTGWTAGSSFSLLAQPLNSDEGSVVAWKESAEEETVQFAGGNGRSGISVLVNVNAPAATGQSLMKRGRIRGWN